MFCRWIVCVRVIGLYRHKYGHFRMILKYCVACVDMCYESSQASNSASYIQDAFQLLMPILEISHIQRRAESTEQ